jgi:hypothetical protein
MNNLLTQAMWTKNHTNFWIVCTVWFLRVSFPVEWWPSWYHARVLDHHSVCTSATCTTSSSQLCLCILGKAIPKHQAVCRQLGYLWLWYYPCNHQINWHKIHVKFFNIWGLPWNSTVGLKFSKVLGKCTNQSCNSRMCKHTWTLWIFIHGEFSLLAPFIFLQIVCLKEEEESSYPDGSLSSDCDHKCLLWLLHDATPTLALLNFGKFFFPWTHNKGAFLKRNHLLACKSKLLNI